MRIPLTLSADSRDGTLAKDAKSVNVLQENDEGTVLACVRPGLAAVSSNSGNGNGLVEFQGVLISVFGTTLGKGTSPSSVGTVTNGMHDFAQSPL